MTEVLNERPAWSGEPPEAPTRRMPRDELRSEESEAPTERSEPAEGEPRDRLF